MNLYPSIAQRKSCRNYNMQPLASETINQMKDALQQFALLYPDLPLKYRFAQKVKGRFRADAPHYLIISRQGAPGEMENAGFWLEQLVLWFDAMEIGCVWLGSSKDADAENKNDMIVLAFGRPAEPIHRATGEFNRKPIGKISNAPDDACIQAARLAPSGLNTQPWYFEKKNEQILVYKKKLKPPISLLYKLSDVDMGIALCHYAVACEQTGTPFHFSRKKELPEKPGYLPFGVIA